MQESLTQKHLAIDSEMLKNAGKGDDGKLGSRLTEITSEASFICNCDYHQWCYQYQQIPPTG